MPHVFVFSMHVCLLHVSHQRAGVVPHRMAGRKDARKLPGASPTEAVRRWRVCPGLVLAHARSEEGCLPVYVASLRRIGRTTTHNHHAAHLPLGRGTAHFRKKGCSRWRHSVPLCPCPRPPAHRPGRA